MLLTAPAKLILAPTDHLVGGTAIAGTMDVRDLDAFTAAVARTESELGGLDFIVSVAGGIGFAASSTSVALSLSGNFFASSYVS